MSIRTKYGTFELEANPNTSNIKEKSQPSSLEKKVATAAIATLSALGSFANLLVSAKGLAPK